MTVSFTITEERLRALLKAAYCDGFDDGSKTGELEGDMREYEMQAHWTDSVTLDQADALLDRIRAGGKP